MILFIFPLFGFAEHDLSVITRKEILIQDLNQDELVRIFTRKKIFWPSGQKIAVFIKPQSSLEHKLFAISVLNLTPYKYKSMVDNEVYTGANNPPTEVDSDEAMIATLSRTPNSIGYVNYSVVINTTNNELITIKVQE